MKNSIKFFLLLLMIFLMLNCPLPAEEQKTFNFSKTTIYPVEEEFKNLYLALETVNGSISAEKSKEGSVKIEVSYEVKCKDKESAETLAENLTKISKTSNKIFCVIKYPANKFKSFKFFRNKDEDSVRASINVYLPQNLAYNTKLNTVNGDIKVNEITTLANEARLVNGKTIFNSSFESLKIENVNGEINIAPPKLNPVNIIEVNIVNGKVNVSFEKEKDAAFNIDAAVLTGSINANLENFDAEKKQFFISKKLQTQSKNFDKAKQKIYIKAHAINGKITIWEK